MFSVENEEMKIAKKWALTTRMIRATPIAKILTTKSNTNTSLVTTTPTTRTRKITSLSKPAMLITAEIRATENLDSLQERDMNCDHVNKYDIKYDGIPENDDIQGTDHDNYATSANIYFTGKTEQQMITYGRQRLFIKHKATRRTQCSTKLDSSCRQWATHKKSRQARFETQGTMSACVSVVHCSEARWLHSLIELPWVKSSSVGTRFLMTKMGFHTQEWSSYPKNMY